MRRGRDHSASRRLHPWDGKGATPSPLATGSRTGIPACSSAHRGRGGGLEGAPDPAPMERGRGSEEVGSLFRCRRGKLRGLKIPVVPWTTWRGLQRSSTQTRKSATVDNRTLLADEFNKNEINVAFLAASWYRARLKGLEDRRALAKPNARLPRKGATFGQRHLSMATAEHDDRMGVDSVRGKSLQETRIPQRRRKRVGEGRSPPP